MNEILIYQAEDKQTRVEVRFEEESFWLTLVQIASLFDRDKSSISRHLKNIFEQGELDQISVVAKNATTAADGKTYQVEYYNLDAILSVGYRVNSRQGTRFRQWATTRLKEYLVDGYSINQKRLAERDMELRDLKNGISILRRSIEHRAIDLVDAGNLAQLLEQFAHGLSLLDDYDHKTLDTAGVTRRPAVVVEIHEYRAVIESMRGEFASELFGREKDDGFESSVRQIYQSYGGLELYPGLEEKAAMLLYLIVKNHSFVDGNKRIAAACFLYFMEKNSLLYAESGNPVIGNDALAAVTLFIAVSKPEEMETVKNVVISILNRKELA
ncbi:MAG: virulence protein RhuM/Fic/DOC family protein [Rectinemataceae bacterium]|nr:virulence protein RhuM/Fic/DOC family protein [Rectinemataceae bacterium]